MDTRVLVVSGNRIFRWIARLDWKQNILLDSDSADRICKNGGYTSTGNIRKQDILLGCEVGLETEYPVE